MKDQVDSLKLSGINAGYINSSLSYTQIHKVLDNAEKGKYKIIYVAPERLDMDSFVEFAKSVDIFMITVDEAHCVSQWGQATVQIVVYYDCF
jgi:ATP-dependent DNA helicase RecQ